MIINNSPALGTFLVRDTDSATLDAKRRGDGIDIEVSDKDGAAYVLFTPNDQFEFTKWLVAQLSDEERAALKANL